MFCRPFPDSVTRGDQDQGDDDHEHERQHQGRSLVVSGHAAGGHQKFAFGAPDSVIVVVAHAVPPGLVAWLLGFH